MSCTMKSARRRHNERAGRNFSGGIVSDHARSLDSSVVGRSRITKPRLVLQRSDRIVVSAKPEEVRLATFLLCSGVILGARKIFPRLNAIQ